MPSKQFDALRERVEAATPEEAKLELLKVLKLARDLKRVNPLEFYVANKPQEIFHRSKKKRRWVVGSNRSGKSEGLVVEDTYWATGHHPYREVPTSTDGWVVCQSVDAQVQAGGIQEKFQKYFPKGRIAAIQRGQKGSWWKLIVTCFFCNLGCTNNDDPKCSGCGKKLSTITFKTYEQDIDIFAGAEIDWVHFDEEPPLNIRTECSFRLSKPRGGWEWCAMTPVKGLSWTFPRIGKPFLDAKKEGREHPEIQVIGATMWDNVQNIGEAYIKSQVAECGADERLYKIRVLGEWTVLSGLVFPYWDPDKNERDDLPAEFLTDDGKIHSDFDVYVGVDTGYNFAATFLLSDYYGNLWIFDEYHAEKQPTPHIAREIKRKCSGWGVNPTYIIDKASSADVDFAEHGIYCTKALPITREEGNEIVGSYIAARGVESGRPMLIVCRERCPEYLRQLSIYQHAPPLKSGPNAGAQKSDVVKRDDHGLDAARFVITTHPAPSRPSPDRDRRPIHTKFLDKVKARIRQEHESEGDGGVSIYEDNIG